MRKEAHPPTMDLKKMPLTVLIEQPGPGPLRSPSLRCHLLRQFPIPIFVNGPSVYSIFQKFVATPEWTDHYKNVKVDHLVQSTSDYCALLLTNAAIIQKLSTKHRFQFEAVWTKRAECRDIIQGA